MTLEYALSGYSGITIIMVSQYQFFNAILLIFCLHLAICAWCISKTSFLLANLGKALPSLLWSCLMSQILAFQEPRWMKKGLGGTWPPFPLLEQI